MSASRVAQDMLLSRAQSALGEASCADDPARRYVTSHLAALRAGAAVLAARTRPGGRGGSRGVWEVLPKAAPELGEWASHFASTAQRRAEVEAFRPNVVTQREADELLADAEQFLAVARSVLGVAS